MALFKNNSFVPDPWRALPDGEPLPHGGGVILTREQWSALNDRERTAGWPLGLVVSAGVQIESLVDALPALSLIALTFPKFSDGRAYSMARQLRGHLGFAGELRAVGDVLYDQLQLMARCGFDTFEITDAATLRNLARGGRPDLKSFYQPGLGREVPAGTRPWARRRAG